MKKTMRQGRATVNQAVRRLAEVVCSMIFLPSGAGREIHDGLSSSDATNGNTDSYV